MSLRCENCKNEKRQCPACRKLAAKIRMQGEHYKAVKGRIDRKRRQTEEYKVKAWERRQTEEYKRVKSEGDKRRRQTEAYKQWKREYDRKKRVTNAEKEKAHAYVNARVRTGQLPPAWSLTCKDCGQPALEYHHESYERDKWLNVIPLCKQCHVNRHPKVTRSRTQSNGNNYQRFEHIEE